MLFNELALKKRIHLPFWDPPTLNLHDLILTSGIIISSRKKVNWQRASIQLADTHTEIQITCPI